MARRRLWGMSGDGLGLLVWGMAQYGHAPSGSSSGGRAASSGGSGSGSQNWWTSFYRQALAPALRMQVEPTQAYIHAQPCLLVWTWTLIWREGGSYDGGLPSSGRL